MRRRYSRKEILDFSRKIHCSFSQEFRWLLTRLRVLDSYYLEWGEEFLLVAALNGEDFLSKGIFGPRFGFASVRRYSLSCNRFEWRSAFYLFWLLRSCCKSRVKLHEQGREFSIYIRGDYFERKFVSRNIFILKSFTLLSHGNLLFIPKKYDQERYWWKKVAKWKHFPVILFILQAKFCGIFRRKFSFA